MSSKCSKFPCCQNIHTEFLNILFLHVFTYVDAVFLMLKWIINIYFQHTSPDAMDSRHHNFSPELTIRSLSHIQGMHTLLPTMTAVREQNGYSLDSHNSKNIAVFLFFFNKNDYLDDLAAWPLNIVCCFLSAIAFTLHLCPICHICPHISSLKLHML